MVKVKIIVSNWKHFSMNVVFFITPNIWLKLKDIHAWWFRHAEYMQTFSPIFKISRTRVWKFHPFSWFCEFVPPIEKMPSFSRKWLRAWYTFWSGVGWGYTCYVIRPCYTVLTTKHGGYWWPGAFLARRHQQIIIMTYVHRYKSGLSQRNAVRTA